MRRTLLLALVAAAAIGTAFLHAESKATMEGTLVDSACYLKDNSLIGNDHGPMKGCGTMCLKGGTPAGLVTKDKKFYAIIAPSTALADHVGVTVRVSGPITNGSILAEKVEVKKGDQWETVKLGSNM